MAQTENPSKNRSRRGEPYVFWACGGVQRFLYYLGFDRLFAEKPMQFADLVLQHPVLRGGDDLFLGPRRCQRTLVRQPTPGEHLARRDPTRELRCSSRFWSKVETRVKPMSLSGSSHKTVCGTIEIST